MRYCTDYVGLSCVDGSCPIANADEYEERGMDVIKKCKDCFYHKGCKDCALAGTNLCRERTGLSGVSDAVRPADRNEESDITA